MDFRATHTIKMEHDLTTTVLEQKAREKSDLGESDVTSRALSC